LPLYLAKWIKTKRVEVRCSQNNLADYLHITREAISRWERNETYPDIVTLGRLFIYFECDAEEIYQVMVKIATDPLSDWD